MMAMADIIGWLVYAEMPGMLDDIQNGEDSIISYFHHHYTSIADITS